MGNLRVRAGARVEGQEAGMEAEACVEGYGSVW